MRRGGFLAGATGGLLLALVIIASGPTASGPLAAGLGLSPSMQAYVSVKVTTSTGSPISTITTMGSPLTLYGGDNSTQYTLVPAGISANFVDAASLRSLGTQPIAVSGLVLLPILAAVFLGLVLYQISRDRKE